MLNFQGCGDFADYFGPRCNYCLGGSIAAIPVPMKFQKGDFQSELAVKNLNDLAENPFPYLDAETKKTLLAVNTMLLRKFSELACDEMVQMRWQEAQPAEADNIDVRPLTEAELQGDLLATSDDPF
jgi:hypothetical protein